MNQADSLFYGYAAFTVPEGSAESDTYALTIKVFNSDAAVPDEDYFEVSVLTTIVQATAPAVCEVPEVIESDDSAS